MQACQAHSKRRGSDVASRHYNSHPGSKVVLLPRIIPVSIKQRSRELKPAAQASPHTEGST